MGGPWRDKLIRIDSVKYGRRAPKFEVISVPFTEDGWIKNFVLNKQEAEETLIAGGFPEGAILRAFIHGLPEVRVIVVGKPETRQRLREVTKEGTAPPQAAKAKSQPMETVTIL